jgi:hypothetical protein
LFLFFNELIRISSANGPDSSHGFAEGPYLRGNLIIVKSLPMKCTGLKAVATGKSISYQPLIDP